MTGAGPVRMLAVWCPDWDTGGAHDPVVVGQAAAAAAFEPVVAALEQVVAEVAVTCPGGCVRSARGPVRYFGSVRAAAERLIDQIAQECGHEALVGVADGAFAAALAARHGHLVPPGRTAAYLAEAPVEALARPGLADLLHRLGIRTLGQFAALPAGDVLARFGFDAAYAHRLAAGDDHRLPAVRRPSPELAVAAEYDEPLARVDEAAFAARALAQRLHDRLAGQGLACTRLEVEVTAGDGGRRCRQWRHDGLLTAAEITDRVRWQLEGWLTSAPPAGGVTRLRLAPDGVVRHTGLQPGLWGEPGEADGRAARAAHRVQGLLGPEAVVTPVLAGGRTPAERVRLVPWGEEPPNVPDPAAPWPGHLPAPSPAWVCPTPEPARLCDDAGQSVRVSARLEVSAAPAWCAVADGPPVAVTGWGGPWPVVRRWWTPDGGARAAWCQVVLADGRALLLACADGRWRVVASYD